MENIYIYIYLPLSLLFVKIEQELIFFYLNEYTLNKLKGKPNTLIGFAY